MRIGLSSDRSGHEVIEHLRVRLSQAQEVFIDSPAGDNTKDYRAVVDRLCARLRRGRIERALLICSRALGASMDANKQPGVRAALCHDVLSVKLGVQDHDMNCLVIDSVTAKLDLACSLADTFCDHNVSHRPAASGMPPKSLLSVVEHIRTNLKRPLDVNRLSELASMSPSHFSKLFKVSMGISPHQFILIERVDRSKQLLSNSTAKIVDIAFEVGFETQAHFTTVFGNLVGMTPMQFRRVSVGDTSLRECRPPQLGSAALVRNEGFHAGPHRNSSISISFPRFDQTGSDRAWLSQ